MQDITVNFDASTVAPQVAFDPLPSGWYNAQITDAEMAPTSSGDGQMLKLTMTVLDGPYAGRKVFDRLNLVNPNPTAVKIAYETLSAIQHAVGVIRCQKVAELAGKPMKVKVKLRPAETVQIKDAMGNVTGSKSYDASNDVKGYDHINSDHAVVTGSAAAGPGAAAGTGAPSWAAMTPPTPVGATTAPTPPAVATAPAWTPPNTAQPWEAAGAPAGAPPAPPVPPAPQAPAAPPAPAPFPPAGWTAHPSSPGWYYMGQEVLSEADLRARCAAPAAPAAAPYTPPTVPGMPPAGATADAPPPWAVQS